ncbi:MAG: DUF2330 domain-containing protein [Armatimonadota bacterium]
MRKIVYAVVFLFLFSNAIALADGMMIIDEATWKQLREKSMINEPEQKAVVFYSKGREQLIISPSYEGPTSNFAWVVPVPSRPKVEIVKGAIFHELMELTIPKTRVFGRGTIASAKPSPAVTVIERKTVGAYDVSVLSARDGKALMKWLKANKYHLPDKAIEPIRDYVKHGWTFVACRIKIPASAKGLSTGTLAPLKLKFSCRQPIYPMKLSSANPKQFDILVYLVMPSTEIEPGQKSIPVIGSPGPIYPSTVYESAVLKAGQKSYPTLAKISSKKLHVYPLNCFVLPKECKQDIKWVIPN